MVASSPARAPASARSRRAIRLALALAALLGTPVAAGLIEVVATDSTIAAHPEFTPVAGQESTRWSTSDGLRFEAGSSTERALWTATSSSSFVRDQDGATVTTELAYQGTATSLEALVFATRSATGIFSPLMTETAQDLTGETGWTAHASCGTVVYQGRFEVASYTSDGSVRPAQLLYYQVCDGSEEIYVNSSRDLQAGDFAYIGSKATPQAETGAPDYEITIEGNSYVFASAASATAVRLRQGLYATSTAAADFYLLHRFPDGFPAGTLTVTLTLTAIAITV